MKTVNIKGKQYVEVAQRILFLSSDKFEYDYDIQTEYEFFESQKMWVVKATLNIYKTEPTSISTEKRTHLRYTGLAQEIIGDGYINKTSALENCETSAVGRACAMAGIGVIDSIASVDEITKAKNRESYNEKEYKGHAKPKPDQETADNIAQTIKDGKYTKEQWEKKYDLTNIIL